MRFTIHIFTYLSDSPIQRPHIITHWKVLENHIFSTDNLKYEGAFARRSMCSKILSSIICYWVHNSGHFLLKFFITIQMYLPVSQLLTISQTTKLMVKTWNSFTILGSPWLSLLRLSNLVTLRGAHSNQNVLPITNIYWPVAVTCNEEASLVLPLLPIGRMLVPNIEMSTSYTHSLPKADYTSSMKNCLTQGKKTKATTIYLPTAQMLHTFKSIFLSLLPCTPMLGIIGYIHTAISFWSWIFMIQPELAGTVDSRNISGFRFYTKQLVIP